MSGRRKARMRVAAVDIGTNTIRCLIAETGEEGILTLSLGREITRLGERLRAAGVLSPEAEERTLAALRRFGETILASGAVRGRAVATSAAREAGSPSFLARAGEALGFPVEAISGEEEAALSLQGMEAGVGGIPEGMALDIGGGSTEVVRVSGGNVLWWRSLPEGVVHLTETYLRGDPPVREETEALRGRLRDLLRPLPGGGGDLLVATAGTPNTLAALDLSLDEYNPALVNGHVLPAHRLEEITARLLARTARERLALPGMEKGREDLIVAGALFLEEVVRRWDFAGVTVSDWGILEGIALDAARSGKGSDLRPRRGRMRGSG